MSWFDLSLLATGAVYLAAIGWLLLGLRRIYPRNRREEPSVSIIVPARNEEEALGACLDALQRQDYAGEWEVIVVDDRSEDGTGELVRARCGDWKRLELIEADERPRFRCPKKSALASGIEASSGELLLFTDADCRPPSGWVRSTVELFTEKVGLVAGYAYPFGGRRLRQKLLALDNLAIGALGAGSFGMGHPLSCTGRNLAYRRRLYDEVGGFAEIGHLTGGDDVYFARLVTAKTDWGMAFNRDVEAAVRCEPPPEKMGDIVQQKLRHAGKTGHYRGPAFLLGVAIYLFHLGLLIALLDMVVKGSWDPISTGIWGMKWAFDAALLGRMSLPEERRLLAGLPLLELCYIPYVLLFSAIGNLGWYRWKN